MAIYLLVIVLVGIPLVFAANLLRVSYRWARRFFFIERAVFTFSSIVVEPGDVIEARATVSPRAKLKVTVHVRLSCTMFDHRGHELYASNRDMLRVPGTENEYATALTVPEYALRSGVIGDSLSTLFSESARRLLVTWSLEFQVRNSAGNTVLRKVYPIDVPAGRPMGVDQHRMSILAIDTFASIKNDMILNWLIHVAAYDGYIDPRERSFLHDVMLEAYGISDPVLADERIDKELRRRLVIDQSLLQRHVPLESRLDLYRLVFAMAWRDGVVHQREHEFMADTLQILGLTPNEVRHVEWEVVRELARNSIR